MRRAVRSALLDRARPPLSQLVRESWIWQGEQPLDGLCCLLGGHSAARRRTALMPYLEYAQAILESPEAIILLFGEPRTLDCDALGSVLPLRRAGSTLTSFPFKPPSNSSALAAIADSVLVTTDGVQECWPLAAFLSAQADDWIDGSSIVIEQTTAPARRSEFREAPGLQLRSDPQFQAVDADAGLRSVREAVGRAPDPNWWERVPSRSGLAVVVGAGVLALIALLGASSSVLQAVVPLIVGFIAVVLGLALLRAVLRGRGVTAATQGRRADRVQRRGAKPLVGGNVFWLICVVVTIAILTRNSDTPVSFFSALLSIVAAGVVLSLLQWLAVRSGIIGSGGGEAGSSRDAYEQPAKPRGSGAFRKWLQKLLQNTPLTDLALNKYDRRVRELQRLFEQGRTEEALKKGLALGARPPPDAGLHADAPIAGPGIRKSLEIEAMRGESESILASLPFGAREALEELYREQAERCLEQGDVAHAAFIYAELLDDPEAAVQVFADDGQFETAARLAQGRRLAPELFIVLWYRAGRKALALRLAERHDAYEMLLLSTQPEDQDFQNEIRLVWAERLARIGDYRRALAVTEVMAAHDAALQKQRFQWMASGLMLAEPEADILARALKALPDDAVHDRDFDAMSMFSELVAGAGIDAARRRKVVAERLLSADFEPHIASDYPRHRLPRIADRLTRRLVADHAEFGLMSSVALLSGLANAGGQMTLAADMRRLPRTRPSRRSQRTGTLTPGPIAGAARVVSAAAMIGNALLVANDDGRLRLLDDKANEIWSDQIWSPQDIVPIYPGRHALIIRNEPNGRRLSVFDSSRRLHAEIGPLALEAWATTAGPEGWLVYADKQVLNLRVDPLMSVLNGPSLTSLEHHWATPITIEGRVRALTRIVGSGEALWLFERWDKVLELWSVTQSDLRVRYNMLAFSSVPAGPSVTADLRTFEVADKDRGPVYHSSALAAPGGREVPPVTLPPVTVVGDVAAGTSSRCVPVAVGRGEAPSLALVSSSGAAAVVIPFDGATSLQMREAVANPRVVVWDDLGRLVVVSTETAELQYANVPTSERSA